MKTHPKENEIHRLCEIGLNDKRISEMLNVSYGIVSGITTNYWKQKMISK